MARETVLLSAKLKDVCFLCCFLRNLILLTFDREKAFIESNGLCVSRI